MVLNFVVEILSANRKCTLLIAAVGILTQTACGFEPTPDCRDQLIQNRIELLDERGKAQGEGVVKWVIRQKQSLLATQTKVRFQWIPDGYAMGFASPVRKGQSAEEDYRRLTLLDESLNRQQIESLRQLKRLKHTRQLGLRLYQADDLGVFLKRAPLPRLTSLVFDRYQVKESTVEALLAWKGIGQIRKLVVGAGMTRGALKLLASGPKLNHLKELSFENRLPEGKGFGTFLEAHDINELIEATGLRRLEVLGLVGTDIDEKTVRTLIEKRPFIRLRELRVPGELQPLVNQLF